MTSTSAPISPSELLLPLHLSHPSVLPLLSLAPSLSSNGFARWCTKVNQGVLSKFPSADNDAAWGIAVELVRQDGEGWVLGEYGRNWLNAALGHLASGQSIRNNPNHLALLATIIMHSPRYPSFEREAVLPLMGKVAVTLTRLLERLLSESQLDLGIIKHTLSTLLKLIHHSPTSFRPSVPFLRPQLTAILLHLSARVKTATGSEAQESAGPSTALPQEHRVLAAEVLAALHLTAGKAQIPGSWSTEMKGALGGLGMALNGVVGEGWQEEPFRVTPPPAPTGIPPLPMDAIERLPIALIHLEGWLELLLALLRHPSSRPVPIPIAQLVAAGLRCLNLTLDTPTVPYISPQHHASLLASLPRIWTVGTLLLSGTAVAVGDHLFPHLSTILDHTVWLAEKTPLVPGLMESHIRLGKFHSLLLTLYPAAVLPLDYSTRLLRLGLSHLSPMLVSRGTGSLLGGGPMGKRGKKRARGAEDGLVGGLEGREGRVLETEQVGLIMVVLEGPQGGELVSSAGEKGELTLHTVITALLPTPLLPPALLTFTIRLLLSIHLALPSSQHLFHSGGDQEKVVGGVQGALEQAALMTEGENGTARGWKSLVLAVLPPLSQLHYFAPETEEEKALRQEMGFIATSDQHDSDPAPTALASNTESPGLALGLGLAQIPIPTPTPTPKPQVVVDDTLPPSAPIPTITFSPAASAEITAGPHTHPRPSTNIPLSPAVADAEAEPILIDPSPNPDLQAGPSPDPGLAPLTAASNEKYPEPVGRAPPPPPTAAASAGGGTGALHPIAEVASAILAERAAARGEGEGSPGDDEAIPELDSGSSDEDEEMDEGEQ